MRIIRSYIIILLLSTFSCTENGEKSDSTIELRNKEKTYSNFELTSHVYLKCAINDSINGEFLFDTGANGLILDKSFLANNNLADRISNSQNGHTYGVGINRTEHQTISDIDISIDNKTFKDLELRVMPLDSIFGRVLNHKIDGIVGYDIFDDYLLKMDFDKSTFNLIDSINPNDKRVYLGLDYTNKYRKPIIKATIIKDKEEQIDCNLIFDMGSGRGISLTKYKGIQENLFTNNLECETDTISGMGGKSESCYLSISGINLGYINTNADTIEVGNDENGALGMHKMYDGLIGMRIIEKFNVIIDQHEKNIWLQERMPVHSK